MTAEENHDDGRENKGYRWKSAFAVLLSLSVLVGGGVFVSIKAYDAWYAFRTVEDYIGEGKDDIEVNIPTGSSLSAIGGILSSADVIKTARAFDTATSEEPNANKIQAGKYKLKTQLPASKALSMLLDSSNLIRIKMTLQEGLTLKQAVPIMAKAAGLSEAQINNALKDPTKLGLPQWANKRVEGFVFPETYELPQNATANQVINLTTTQFSKVSASINFVNRAATNDVTAMQALTIASIIEAEVHQTENQAKVSRVIYNRLAKGMPLQMDSTVHYAVGKSGSVTTTDQERATKSVYNTYIHKGLPPGPIGSPGQTAMEAALSPEQGDWLYFVTVNLDTGETLFASTDAAHQENVKKFQQWCQDNSGRC